MATANQTVNTKYSRRVHINAHLSQPPPASPPPAPMTHEEALTGPHMRLENTKPAEPEKPKKD